MENEIELRRGTLCDLTGITRHDTRYNGGGGSPGGSAPKKSDGYELPFNETVFLDPEHPIVSIEYDCQKWLDACRAEGNTYVEGTFSPDTLFITIGEHVLPLETRAA